MNTRKLPIYSPLNKAMLNWVVMNIIHMAFKIIVVPYKMFPKPPLPNAPLTF